MDKILAIVGFVFLIAGLMGLFITFTMLDSESVHWIVSTFTFGTFASVGLGIIIGLIVTSE